MPQQQHPPAPIHRDAPASAHCPVAVPEAVLEMKTAVGGPGRQVHPVRLVERRPDPDDGRAVQLAATDAGRALFDQMRAERDGLIASVLVDWDPADVATLAHLLDRFTTDLEHHRPRLLKTIDSLETS